MEAVEFGKEVRRAPSAGKPLVTEDIENGDLEVDTGPLKMVLSGEKPAFFGELTFAGRKVTKPPEGGELYLKLGDPGMA